MVDAAIGPVILGVALAGFVIAIIPKEPTIYDPSKADFSKVQFENAQALNKDGTSKKNKNGEEEKSKSQLPKPVSMKEIDASNKETKTTAPA